jgi:hypothetical protein
VDNTVQIFHFEFAKAIIFDINEVIRKKERLNMDTDSYIITSCPSCECRYRTPGELIGRKVLCKKCGTGFRLYIPKKIKQEHDRQNTSSEQDEVWEISQDDSYSVIGKLAVKYKLVNDEQVKKALSIQAKEERAGRKLLLGEILVAQRMISETQLEFLFSIQNMVETRRREGKFGAIAISEGFTTRDEINKALEEQNRIFKETKTIKLIGDILVESKMLTKDQRNAVLKRQKRFEKITSAEQKRPDVPDSEEPIESAAEFNLNVSEDNLNAFISNRREISAPITNDNIKNFLQMKGIVYGIVDDNKITEYLKIIDSKKEALKIAEGKPPEPGKDAYVKYYFETDPLKVGAVKDGGGIDFKDRGDIPHVKEGDLLVEKIPVVEGRPGTDVYGDPIPPPKPNDIKLKYGKGAKISDDRLKIIAKVDGIPEISAMKKVYVSPQLKISGDIGLKTGHVDFDGKIDVSETIQNGFRVKGNSLTAKEIFKAEVEMSGDIVVYGGIIGATIKTGGNIRAMYIHESRIEAYGDVVLEKEIIDSKVDTSGACIVNRGPILSSTVGARKGIRAVSIGSEISKPCNLMVGEDERIKNEIDRLKEAVLLKIQDHKKLKRRLEEIKDEPKKIEKQIAEMAQVQDKRMVRKRNIEERIKELKETGNKARIEDAEADLKILVSELETGEKNLENLFNKQDRIIEEIPDIQKKIKDTKSEIKEMKFKISEIIEWSEREKGIPEVRVKDIIFADTTINGFYSSRQLTRDYKSVLIKEIIKQRVNDGSNSNPHQEESGSKISIRPLEKLIVSGV